MRELLKDLARQGTTILLSSHILSEISKVATRIGIIHEGSLIQELFTHDLENQLIQRLIIDTADNERAIHVLEYAGYEVQITGAKLMELGDPKALEHPESISTLLVEKGCPPTQLYRYVEDLEQYFLRVIKEAAE